MSRRDKRRADALLSTSSTPGPPSTNAPIASTSTSHLQPQSPEPRRSKRRKIDPNAADVATLTSTSTSDVVSTSSRAHQLLSKKRTRKARLAAETKVNVVAYPKPLRIDTDQSGPSARLRSAVSAPLTPDSEVHELESVSALEDDGPEVDSTLQDKVAALEAQLREKDQQITAQRTILDTLHQQVQCQICLEAFVQPFTLVPCGHIACMKCLQQWFKTSNAANEEIYGPTPAIRRKKTCPHCRTQVIQRPVASHLLKGITNEVETGWASITAQTPPPQQDPVEGDPWLGIFPSERNGANREADGAIIDHEDGGVRRCPHCLTEIYHGVCQGCGEEYDVEDTSDESLDLHIPHPDLAAYFAPQQAPVDRYDEAARYWRRVYDLHLDDDEEEEDGDEDDRQFINDGPVEDPEEYESDEYASDHGVDRYVPYQRRRREDIETISVDDTDPEEDEEIVYQGRRRFIQGPIDSEEDEVVLQEGRRRASPRIILSDEELGEIASDEDDATPQREIVYVRRPRVVVSDDEAPPPPPRQQMVHLPPINVHPLPRNHYYIAEARRIDSADEASSDGEDFYGGAQQFSGDLHYVDDNVYDDDQELDGELRTISDMDDQNDGYYSDEY